MSNNNNSALGWIVGGVVGAVGAFVVVVANYLETHNRARVPPGP